jgi:hypothetical protein
MDLGSRKLILSTQWRRYGGERSEDEPAERLYPYEMALFGETGG